jgi:cell division protein FtsZ
MLFEISPIKDIDFNTLSSIEVKAVQPKSYRKTRTNYFSLIHHFLKRNQLPVEESKVIKLTNETRDIKVNEPVQFVPVTELTDNGIIKYS